MDTEIADDLEKEDIDFVRLFYRFSVSGSLFTFPLLHSYLKIATSLIIHDRE